MSKETQKLNTYFESTVPFFPSSAPDCTELIISLYNDCT